MTTKHSPALHTAIIGWRGKVPILAAQQVGAALTFWCERCRERHWHVDLGEGQHQAACTEPSSPFLASGYVLRGYRPGEQAAIEAA